MLGRIVLKLIGLWMFLYILLIPVLPTLAVYRHLGLEWAAVTAIGTVGVLAFLVKFGPWLIVRFIAKGILADIDLAIADLDGETPYIDAMENHARAEGAEYWLLDL